MGALPVPAQPSSSENPVRFSAGRHGHMAARGIGTDSAGRSDQFRLPHLCAPAGKCQSY